MFVAAIMRVNEHIIERYRALAYTDTNIAALTSAQMARRYQVRSKFGASAFPWIREWIDETRDWELYPIYQVRQRGKWHAERALLLGDAAHAVSMSGLFTVRIAPLNDNCRCHHARNQPHTPSKMRSYSRKFLLEAVIVLSIIYF
jgi:hypothetical protein